jgi:hypothetical protein
VLRYDEDRCNLLGVLTIAELDGLLERLYGPKCRRGGALGLLKRVDEGGEA